MGGTQRPFQLKDSTQQPEQENKKKEKKEKRRRKKRKGKRQAQRATLRHGIVMTPLAVIKS